MGWDKWPELRDLVQQKQEETRRTVEERQREVERRAQEATLEEARKQKLAEAFNGLLGQYKNSVPGLLQMVGVAQWGEGNFQPKLDFQPPSVTRVGLSYATRVEAGCTWLVEHPLTQGQGDGEQVFRVELRVWEESGSIRSGFKVNYRNEVVATEDALKKALLEAYKKGPEHVGYVSSGIITYDPSGPDPLSVS